MSKKLAGIKIALNGIVPQIYRRVEVPLEFSLRDLHFTIQVAMPWKCSHLYEFGIGGISYGDPHPPNEPYGFGLIDAASKKLASLIKSKGDRFLYTYDFRRQLATPHHRRKGTRPRPQGDLPEMDRRQEASAAN